MDAALKKKDEQREQLARRHNADMERVQRDIDEIIKPFCKKYGANVKVSQSYEDRVYNIHLSVQEEFLDGARRLPQRGIESMVREIAMQLMYRVEKKAREPYEARR